jgi:anti-repressor protein
MHKAELHLNQQMVSNPLPLSTDRGSSAIVPFTFEGRQLRAHRENNSEPLFVARDVVKAVDAKWHSNAIKHIPDRWKGVKPITTPGGVQQMAVLTEQGVFFYLARSDKPKALPIQMWLAGEVLPSIRRTGGYGAPSIQALMADPDALLQLAAHHAAARKDVEIKLLASESHAAQLAGKVEEMASDVAALDRIAKSDGSMCIREVAKDLQIKPQKNLFDYLLTNSWIYKQSGCNQAYQTRIDQGVLEHKVTVVTRSNGTEKVVSQVRVTPKGIKALAKVFSAKEEKAA